MELKDYKQLLINYPKDSADPFEYLLLQCQSKLVQSEQGVLYD